MKWYARDYGGSWENASKKVNFAGECWEILPGTQISCPRGSVSASLPRRWGNCWRSGRPSRLSSAAARPLPPSPWTNEPAPWCWVPWPVAPGWLCVSPRSTRPPAVDLQWWRFDDLGPPSSWDSRPQKSRRRPFRRSSPHSPPRYWLAGIFFARPMSELMLVRSKKYTKSMTNKQRWNTKSKVTYQTTSINQSINQSHTYRSNNWLTINQSINQSKHRRKTEILTSWITTVSPNQIPKPLSEPDFPSGFFSPVNATSRQNTIPLRIMAVVFSLMTSTPSRNSNPVAKL